MKNQVYYIPKHAHAKAIAYYKKHRAKEKYPVREVDGVTGEVIRWVERKKVVHGLRVYFIRYRHCSSELYFERTF